MAKDESGEKCMDVKITASHVDEVLNKLKSQKERALNEVGLQCENYAKDNITSAGRTSPSGTLRNSITHKVQGDTVYIGTILFYAPYHEFGTGQYAEQGGKSGYWVYVPGGGGGGKSTGKRYSAEEARRIVAILKSKGVDAHMTSGIRPIHFLRNAVQDHIDEYERMIKEALES